MSNGSLRRVVHGSGPGLLLAHGAGGGIDANFGPIMDGLAERYTVVGPDYPGTGRTPRATSPLDPDHLADELVAAAVAEGIETFAIIGYSLGTALAVRAATRHPDRVTALVLTAGFAKANPRLLVATRLWRSLLAEPDHQRLAEFLALVGLGAPAADALRAQELETALAQAAATVPPGIREHVDLVDAVDVRADLSHIAVPTLAISTKHDGLVTPVLHRELADGIPGAKLVEIESGHLPFAERPADWLGLIREFLDGLYQ